MGKVEILTFESMIRLVNLNSIYLLGYAWLFGMSVWVTFFGGFIAFRTLPRHQFGALQHKTFPVYLLLSLIISTALLCLWIWKHPDVLQHIDHPERTDVAQVYALSSVVYMQALNYFLIAPLTSNFSFRRQKLEKEEGKDHTNPEVSEDMKRLNRSFAWLHGASSLANLSAVLSLLIHGLWLGDAGMKNML